MIRAQVTLVVGAASVALTRLRAQLGYEQLSARVGYEHPVAAVGLDPLARNPVLVELVRPSDSVHIVVSFFRTAADGAQGSDTATREMGKVRSDVTRAEDALARASGKPLQDQGAAAELAAKGLAKPATDAAAAGDESFRGFGAGKADAAGATDLLGRTVQFSRELVDLYALDYFAEDYTVTGRVLLADTLQRVAAFRRAAVDQVQMTDTALKGLGRPLNDAAGGSDTFDRVVTYARFAFDQVGATDDLGGALSADDDQTLSFTKALDRTARAADALAWGLARQAVDSGIVSDALRYGAGKPLADGAGAADAAQRGFGKPAADAIVVGDLLASRAAGKAAASAASAADSGAVFYANYAIDYFAADYCGTTTTF